MGSRGFPREPQEIQEGCQRLPEAPRGSQRFQRLPDVPRGSQRLPGGLQRLPEAIASSKNAYFEDVFNMAKKLYKMPKNGPKSFQTGSRLLKLLKIAPKIQSHKDF